ncbi:alpha/beta hydrolase [Aggregatibacter aphrophilus]|uniref:Alpha/beta hydrolase of uncharacterized function (DUF900) n=1 Tax=Aggregatibacter aphrophilus ATCC 33389 TaxID=985008 RepID=A0A3S4TZJ2_AGGAP|nr:alpha/beta hydrolase [Aggregatibacter aphrophilus]KNE84545.1 alpha/beta hydrolase [Aggregatibacter aphrophilus ATCC 33389]OBY50519.1 alpha/beta hydrolase [Aggregatibacter aphrophilus]RDE88539.1 alpha/beta hydrolase [Aggregatibacter aphrophilus]VEF42488.1 Alpha/beta hydrolase of uncharacterised function (DUF900) [Aggregatibacter aphrophilus ATCC 33389]
MANTTTQPFYHQFEEAHRSESTKTGTAACRTNIIIHHKDTLDRPLPAGIMVKVYDQDGGVSYGEIDKNGDSHHLSVKCGLISWQLMRGPDTAPKYDRHKKDGRQLTDKDEQAFFNDSDGYVLIKANDEKTKDPRLQLAKPLKVFVSVNITKVKAIYLPPPILLNLRFRQNSKAGLSSKQLQQIEKDGKTATLFIHGYNVSLGHIGKFPQAKDFGNLPEYSNLPPAEQVQRPYLHYDNEAIGQLVRKVILEQAKEDEEIHLERIYNEIDLKVNSHKALGWFPHVEYYLNLAASGKLNSDEPFTDWEKYHRIIGVTWSGSVDPSMVFFRAEMYANEAGRELAKVLIELFNKGIKVNIITHSLGARVALSALNILGDFDGAYDEKIDNLIMWEAAVADNSITNKYTRVKNPVAMELFPYAHKTVKYIRVLYSQEDGVLDGDSRGGDQEYTGLIGGAYPMKYSSLANTTGALKDYYYKLNLIGKYYETVEQLRRNVLIHRGSLNQDDIAEYNNIENTAKGREIKQKIEKLLVEEANKVSSDLEKPLNYLKPWSHYRRFRPEDEYFKHIIDVLTYQVFNNWTIYIKNMWVRSALGHQGNRLSVRGIGFKNKELSKRQQEEGFDKFIADNTSNNGENKKFWFWDQSNYFISHSAMREWEWKALDSQKVFPDIYKESYKNQIIDRWIKKNSNFGRY